MLKKIYNGLSSLGAENDVLLTTHSHHDHYNDNFLNSFPGQQLQFEPGEIELADTMVKSSHITEKKLFF